MIHGILIAAIFAAGTTVIAAPPQSQSAPYLAAVEKCLQTLIENGTDRYGAEQSPLFSSVLDLKTLRMPDQPPALLPGQRPQDRAYPGCNMQHDMHTLILMDHVSKITGNARYTQHVDKYLEFFLRRCAGAGNGLFPCGEHAFWNFNREAISSPIQEDLGAVPEAFLERLWTINPAAVEKHIRGLERHFLEGEGWVWNRHASITKDERPKEPAAFPRHGGFYVQHWAFLYMKTGDDRLLDLASRTANAASGIDHSMASLGISLLRANRILEARAVPEFDALGRRLVKRLTSDPNNKPSEGVLVMYKNLAASTKRISPLGTWGYWDMLYSGSGGYGFLGAERYANECLAAHSLTKDEELVAFAQAVCGYYMTHPRPAGSVMTPGKFAGIIALALQLRELTGEAKYLDFAKRLADEAMAELYADGLFRAGTGADHYEAANGAGGLMTELIRLHLILTDNPYPLPPCDNDI